MEVLRELTDVPGRYNNVSPVPRVLWHGGTELTYRRFANGCIGRAELTDVLGTGMELVYKERTEVPAQVIPRKTTRAWFCTHPAVVFVVFGGCD